MSSQQLKISPKHSVKDATSSTRNLLSSSLLLHDLQDDAVWYNNSEEMEDAEDVIDNEVETKSEDKSGDYKYTSTSKTALFRATKSNEVNNEHSLT